MSCKSTEKSNLKVPKVFGAKPIVYVDPYQVGVGERVLSGIICVVYSISTPFVFGEASQWSTFGLKLWSSSAPWQTDGGYKDNTLKWTIEAAMRVRRVKIVESWVSWYAEVHV